MKVWVAEYHYNDGIDIPRTKVAVFSSEEHALSWRDWIARDNWAEAFPDEAMPDKDIGHVYFSNVHYTEDNAEEWFTVEQQTVDANPFLPNL